MEIAEYVFPCNQLVIGQSTLSIMSACFTLHRRVFRPGVHQEWSEDPERDMGRRRGLIQM